MPKSPLVVQFVLATENCYGVIFIYSKAIRHLCKCVTAAMTSSILNWSCRLITDQLFGLDCVYTTYRPSSLSPGLLEERDARLEVPACWPHATGAHWGGGGFRTTRRNGKQ